MDQRQCPLFRLPRELRDEIYENYAYHERGLVYDYTSSNLRCPDGRDLNLACTCKVVADEMRGVHLRVNVVTFMPSCDKSREETEFGLRTRASRFEHLQYAIRWTKVVMLHYVMESVTENDVRKVIEAYPSVSGVFRPAPQSIRGGSSWRSMSRRSRLPRDLFNASFMMPRNALLILSQFTRGSKISYQKHVPYLNTTPGSNRLLSRGRIDRSLHGGLNYGAFPPAMSFLTWKPY